MHDLPGVLIVVDSMKEDIAISEAQKLNIPIVAVVDTNGDPENIDYAIPGNDDAVRAIELFTAKISEAVMEGKKKKMEKELQEMKTEETEEGIESKEEQVSSTEEIVQEAEGEAESEKKSKSEDEKEKTDLPEAEKSGEPE
jgi:small subunit ribosomal protein S2